MDLRKKDSQLQDGATNPGSANKPEPPKKNLLTWVMIFFAVPVMAVIESAKGLTRRVYDGGWFAPLRVIIGILAALGAGIGTGYFEGWLNNWSWYAWLPAALAATVATFVYVWPLAYLALVKPVQRLSQELWDAVPKKDHWFSDFLKVVARVAVFGLAGYEAWSSGNSALANLTASGWGPFAYVGAFVWAAFVGVITASFGWSLFTTSIYGICVASGAAVSWALMPLTKGYLAHFGLVAPVWGFAASALEFALWGAFAFPLLVVIGSHGLRFVKDLSVRVYKGAYEQTVGVYEGVFTQLVNIWTAYHLASLSLVGLALVGVTLQGWMLYAVPSVVALLSYLAVGQILRGIKNKGLGVIAAAHAVRWAVFFTAGFTLPWVIGLSAAAAVFTFYVAYPLAYVLVRSVGKFVLDNKVAGSLITAHDKACDAAEQFAKEVARARKNTYGDTGWFASMFHHVVNLAALVPVWFYASGFLAAVGMTGWMAWGLTGLALVLSYLLVGRLLVKSENVVVGIAAALVGAVVTGVFAYAHQTHGLWVAIPAALVGGGLVFMYAFPIAYVCARFVVSVIDGIVPLFSKLVEPVTRSVHEFCWKQASGLAHQFRLAYNIARDAFKPAWASVSKAWNEAWASVKETWESIKRR
jgi:hypothetical protein